MDAIRINRIRVFAFHGCRDKEKSSGQNFEIDVELRGYFTEWLSEDSLEQLPDVDEVYAVVTEFAAAKRYNLIETLAENISLLLLNEYKVKNVLVRVRKPDLVFTDNSAEFEVEICR